MHARRTVWLMIVLLAWLPLTLAACAGGSGSSGFDAAPQSENAAIATALEEQRCVPHEGLEICPVGPPSNNTGHVPDVPHVDTGLDRATTVACAAGGTDTACNFLLPFIPEGFPPSAAFRVALRNINPNGPWRITDTPLPSGPPSTPEFDVPVNVEVGPRQPSPDEHVQLAILAFLEPPRAVPMVVQELSDSGADFAFVTSELTLQFNL